MGDVRNQIGQIAEFMGQIREQSELSSSTSVNLMGEFEIAEAITLRSGMEVVGDLKVSNHSLEVDKDELFEEDEEDLAMASLEEALPQHPIIPNPSAAATLAPPPSNSSKVVHNSILSNLNPQNIPFPCRFLQSKKEEREKDIFITFPKVQVNMSILDKVKQLQKFAKNKKKGLYNEKKYSRERNGWGISRIH
ncbi:hypothetical protein TB2_022236 [Malus domestica]